MLIALLLIIRQQSNIIFPSKRLLKIIINVTIISIIMEPLSWIFDDIPTTVGFILNHISNALLVLLSPVLVGLFASYIDLKLNNSWKRLVRRRFYQLPAAVVGLLLLVNLFFPIFFYIDRQSNVFHQLPFQMAIMALVAVVYIILFTAVIRARKRSETRLIRVVIIFLAVPIAGMVIQLVNYHLNFSWTTISIAILIAYSYLESTPGEKDFLTDLYSRSIYDRYVSVLTARSIPFRLMMIDLNDFKAINDREGHLAGDVVLKHFSAILKRVFSREHMVARLAGDEFIIVIESDPFHEDAVIDQIIHACKNHESPLMQNLRFSYGLESYRDGMTFDEIYMRVDEKMYTHKQEMKRTIGV